MRIGIGYDIHALVKGRKLVLGGVTVPFSKGLKGHSDGDALFHAVTDAIMGAAGAGDIGEHFPDDDPKNAGSASVRFLKKAVEVARKKGYAVANVDAVIVAEAPKLGPLKVSMRRAIAAALGIPADRVSVKAKTNEGFGAIGKGHAIACHAAALLVPVKKRRAR